MTEAEKITKIFNHLRSTPEGRQRHVDAYWKTLRDKVDELKTTNRLEIE